jgi:hypothetical protein
MEAWDYDKYVQGLKSGNVDFNQEFAKMGGLAARSTQNLYREILAQQAAGSSDFWYAGNTASKEAAAADFALRLAENGIGSLSQLGQITIPGGVDGEGGSMPDEQVTINTTTGQPIPRPELLGRGNRDLDIDYNLIFTANGQVIPYTSNRESSWMSFRENALKPAASFALAYFGAPMIGAAVAPAATAATQAAIGGAIAGGGSAALTDGNVLQGALLGGAGGYLRGAASVPASDSIYSLATGTPNLDYMGGGQGLMSTGSANLASMGGAQGLQILAGLPSTTVAEALNTFGGVNPSVLPGMGAGTGITLNTPTGLVTGTGTINPGNVISETGINTGFNTTDFLNANVGAGLGTTLADVNTGINSGATTAGTSTSGLTNSQIASLLNAGLGLAGLGATAGIGSGGASTTMQSPTQGLAAYTPEYYQQLQQYYNSYLPQTPRDVVTPLQQWYSGAFGQTPPTYASIAANTAVNVPNNTGSITDPALVAAINALTNRTATTATTGTTARPVTPTAVTPVTPVTTTAPPSGLLNSALLNDSVYRDTAQAVAATGTPAQKAEWYNSMLSSGYDDASVKALVDSAVGQQTASDWAYLQQLAASQTAQPEVYQPPVYQPEVYQPPAVSVQPPINPPLPVSSNLSLFNDAVYRDTAQTVASTGTPAQKAEWYNSMIGSGYSDAAVKALVDSAVGPQSSSDWAYLQQLAASR